MIVTTIAFRILVFLGAVAVATSGGAVEGQSDGLRDIPSRETVLGRHTIWEGLLRAGVHEGVVDYAYFQSQEHVLDEYLSVLAGTDPATLSRDEALALWINAYNAYTIKLILDRYPDIESIRDIRRPWKRRDWVVGGRVLSLDQIEHDILRKEFEEPRIHFAIVCASLSCPDLSSEAYVGARLDEQLTRAARRFLADEEKGFRLEPDGDRHRVRVSSIFKWFRGDFEAASGSVLNFILPYLPGSARNSLAAQEHEPSIKHLDYDWSLNGR